MTEPVTIVTGGSTGIGFAMARRSVAAGENVVLIARDAERLEAAASELRAQARTERRVLSVPIDVTADGAAERLEAHLVEAGLHPAVLVNNAGMGLAGAFADNDLHDLERLLALNVAAVTRLTRHFLPGMIARGSGVIINVSSLGGFTPGPYQAAYYASKAYVNALTEAIGWETFGTGVSVILVAPGPVDTRFHHAMRAERALYRLLLPAMSPQAVARWVWWGRRLGLRVVVPGLVYRLASLAVRIVPHPISLPLVSVLLRPRRR
ncbi:MAG: SDR family NAD(P)-dependent oxidoreductase [Hyphomicrobiaceae bacterium]